VTEPSRRAAEAAARDAYGRLLASLAARSGDIAGAEDALAEAFAAALATWPERGVPDAPEAWLLTAARRNVGHAVRHRGVRDRSEPERILLAEEREVREACWSNVDERLKLLFVCAHPAIDPAARTPLMLQAVLGLDAARIASAFLVSPTAMSQRLVRAKLKIKAARIGFRVPDAAELPGRLDDVLQAIYAAFGAGWDDMAAGRDLAEEALFLGRLLGRLLPDEPEVLGLVALMAFCEARRGARRDERGRFVPLSEQDPRRWSEPLVREAESMLAKASQFKRFGRFQCEAAIQSAHAHRAFTGEPQYAAILALYDLLWAHAPSLGVAIGRAAARIDAGDFASAAAALDALDPGDVASYQPYWVTRARLARALGDDAVERAHLTRALGLTEDAAVRAFLAARLGGDPG
jgi:RNA polymerase sigma-70 factor (ECF subfamily)